MTRPIVPCARCNKPIIWPDWCTQAVRRYSCNRCDSAWISDEMTWRRGGVRKARERREER